MVLFSGQQKGSTIIFEPDILGVGEVSLTDWYLHGDPSFVRFVTVGTAREEEVTVNLVRVLFEPLLQDSVSLIALLSFERMGNFSVMDSRDKPIGNGADCL